MRPALPLALLLLLPLAGCAAPQPVLGPAGYAALGFDGATWPDLHGATVRILAYEAFNADFKDAKERFERRTNGTAELLTEADAGKVLARALREKGDPGFDVLYGLDNVLVGKAAREGVLQPYAPVLGSRVPAQFAVAAGWLATPVDHGYIAVNVDSRANLTVRTLDDVRAHAAQFVTEDPRTSTPGLGFLLATVATYGEKPASSYGWLAYWHDLLRGGALVASDWTDAYANHFSGGYGASEPGSMADRAIVTSYTTSPAYEVFYGADHLNANVLAPRATFHQVQTMAIAHGARNLAPAQAWVEFSLTEDFQSLAAPGEAIYPVVGDANVTSTFGGKDPPPGSFVDTGLGAAQLDANVDRWLREWTDQYERDRA
ncbi:MAG: thiamine ABC transporter substrate-binding protein [Halobacteriales archaeon]|nr:thiamine ABC transporter substrate-binding protein [Halobacteriales archaeon]